MLLPLPRSRPNESGHSPWTWLRDRGTQRIESPSQIEEEDPLARWSRTVRYYRRRRQCNRLVPPFSQIGTFENRGINGLPVPCLRRRLSAPYFERQRDRDLTPGEEAVDLGGRTHHAQRGGGYVALCHALGWND